MWSRNIRFAPAEKRKEHIVSDEKNCKRSEKPVYFQNFRKNAVLHGQPDYFRFYRGRYGRTICKLLYDYAGDQQYSHDPCEYDPADGRRLFYRKNRQRNYEILRQLTFGFFCIASVVSVGLFSLITPFVRDIWLGPSYELGWGITVFVL